MFKILFFKTKNKDSSEIRAYYTEDQRPTLSDKYLLITNSEQTIKE